VIDKDIFAHQMGVLADRIGRPLKAPTLRMYFQSLSAELTTEQFVAATTLAFNLHDGKYRDWPSPMQLVELIRPLPGPTLDAFEAFERVLALTNDPRTSLPRRIEAIQAIGATAVRAFRAAGGMRDFVNVLETDVVWLRRRFVEAYTAATETAIAERDASLALAKADDQVVALVQSVAAARAIAPTNSRALNP
jgi:hypothetical protein